MSVLFFFSHKSADWCLLIPILIVIKSSVHCVLQPGHTIDNLIQKNHLSASSKNFIDLIGACRSRFIVSSAQFVPCGSGRPRGAAREAGARLWSVGFHAPPEPWALFPATVLTGFVQTASPFPTQTRGHFLSEQILGYKVGVKSCFQITT